MIRKILVISKLVLVSVVVGFVLTSKASAAFYPNNLIDDPIFDNANTMTASQIDNWLNTNFGSASCISTAHGFSAPDPTGYNPTNGFTYGANVSAGQIIYDSAQAYGLNPQVLLTTLEKEQSLVSGGVGCSTLRYAAATGYGCPDGGTTYNYSGVDLYSINGVAVTAVSGTCVNTSLKVGFSQQVIRAAWLLKFGEQRSEGNINWAVIKGNWNNSDDPQTCYSGPMTQGTWQICPSGATTYYDGYTTIDSSSVHMDNGATAALYWYTPHFAGNQNFDSIFQQWFGSLIGSYLVRTVSNSTVYLLSGNYKYPIADMNVLNDFSPLGSVQFVSDTYVNEYATGPTLGHMVGDSGGTLYFVNAGIKLPFNTCTAVSNYGYSCSSVITLTNLQLSKLATGPLMTSLYSTTNGKSFYISAGQKHEIFDQQSLAQASITGSPNVLLEGGLAYLPYGTPIIRDGVVVQDRNSGQKYYYEASRYVLLSSDVAILPAFSSLTQGQFDDLSIPQAQRYTNFNGFISNTANSAYYALLNSGKALLSSPASWTGSYTTFSDTFLNAVPTSTDPINTNLIKSPLSPTVYYMVGGNKRPITSWSDLVSLHTQPLAINTLPDSTISQIPTGTMMYGVGSLVKTASSSTVYVVKSPTELFPISSFTFPSELGLSLYIRIMSNAEFQGYTVLPVLQSKLACGPTDYVGTNGAVHAISTNMLNAYGFTQSEFTDAGVVCNNVPISNQAFDQYIRVSNSTIYYVSNGQKQAFTNYAAYINHGGNSSNTLQVSDYFAGTIPSGTNITQ